MHFDNVLALIENSNNTVTLPDWSTAVACAVIFLPILAYIIWLIITKKKSDTFCNTELGMRIIDFIIANNGFNEEELKKKFSNLPLTYKKICIYVSLNEKIRDNFRFNKVLNSICEREQTTRLSINNQSCYHKKDILKVYNYYKQYASNKDLSTIVLNYLKKEQIDLIALEIGSILFSANAHDLQNLFKEDNNEYFSFLMIVYRINSSKLEEVENIALKSEGLISFRRLFLMLQEQSIIAVSDSKNEKNFAFIGLSFLAYTLKKDELLNQINNINIRVKIDLENNTSESLIKLSEIVGEETAIFMYVVFMSIKTKKLIFYSFDIYQKIAQKILTNYKQKNEIDNLLTENVKFSKHTIQEVDLMNGEEFERFVLELFKKEGYSCSLTKKTRDQGVDVIAIKGTIKIAIQCKRYTDAVGNHAIMEVNAGKTYYRCNKAMVITNNYFTKGAIDLAEQIDVGLWDRDELEKRL